MKFRAASMDHTILTSQWRLEANNHLWCFPLSKDPDQCAQVMERVWKELEFDGVVRVDTESIYHVKPNVAIPHTRAAVLVTAAN